MFQGLGHGASPELRERAVLDGVLLEYGCLTSPNLIVNGLAGTLWEGMRTVKAKSSFGKWRKISVLMLPTQRDLHSETITGFTD